MRGPRPDAVESIGLALLGALVVLKGVLVAADYWGG